jgi:hypothetical protein
MVNLLVQPSLTTQIFYEIALISSMVLLTDDEKLKAVEFMCDSLFQIQTLTTSTPFL